MTAIHQVKRLVDKARKAAKPRPQPMGEAPLVESGVIEGWRVGLSLRRLGNEKGETDDWWWLSASPHPPGRTVAEVDLHHLGEILRHAHDLTDKHTPDDLGEWELGRDPMHFTWFSTPPKEATELS